MNKIYLIIIIFLIIKYLLVDSEKIIRSLVDKNTNINFIDKNSIIKKNNSLTIILNNKDFFKKIINNPELGLAESYINSDWDTENLKEILVELIKKEKIINKEIMSHSIHFFVKHIIGKIKSKMENNTIKKSKENIAKHYDIGNDLYTKMLGKHMQYTCAYFYKPNMTLDQAQKAKMELIAKKLDLKEGMKVLDIGCGFGSMGYHLAKNYNVKVIGVTLSEEQKKYADEKFVHENLKIILKDYRHVDEKFDRVYSVGMFEHVGRKNYKEYYDKCYNLLKNDGIMIIHTIGTHLRKWTHNSFINKYIFPEGELPHLSNLTKEFTDNWNLEDMQNFGISYSKTLDNWYNNIKNWEGLDNYDEKFRRMWKFYLLGCSAVFLCRYSYLWQLVYTKKSTNRTDDCHHIRN